MVESADFVVHDKRRIVGLAAQVSRGQLFSETSESKGLPVSPMPTRRVQT